MEAALGMSYAGKRSMVCMKHSGLMWPLMLL
jgi:TPP-dependent indolepyruvate ferredoxin oxidoreductase alpha subunit